MYMTDSYLMHFVPVETERERACKSKSYWLADTMAFLIRSHPS